MYIMGNLTRRCMMKTDIWIQQVFSNKSNIFLTLAWIFAVAGCGGGSSGGNDNSNTNTNTNGKVIVDGHEFNPEFVAGNEDFYAKVAYFNVAGKLSSQHDIFEWNGRDPTYSEDFRYTYDSAGRLISQEHEFTYTREGLALWEHVFSTITYTYDISGNLSTETRIVDRFDNDADGVYDDASFGTFPGAVRYIITYTYNGSGQLTGKVYDDGGDGDLMGSSGDEQITYEYDGSGNLIKEITLDGIGITETLVNTYNSSNELTRQTRYPTQTRFDANDPNQATDYIYNSNGNLISEEIDSGVAHSSVQTLDGTPDTIVSYSYGANGEAIEKLTEVIRISSSQTDTIKYLHEVVDDNGDGTPESTITYVFWLDTVVDTGGGYPSELLPSWVQNAQTSLNNGDTSDGWGVNWDGHGSTCSTCGNMIGQVTRVLYGF